jgi:hypothetical protein
MKPRFYLLYSSLTALSGVMAWADGGFDPSIIRPVVSERPVIGVVGDSLSDEYSTYPYGFAERNWTLLLEDTDFADLGEFKSIRMYPRLYGFEYNWARAGAKAADVIGEGQLLGLAWQILRGDVEVAVVLVGANDFGGIYSRLYDGQWDAAAEEIFEEQLLSHFKTMLSTLSAAKPPVLIVGTIPDLGDTLTYRMGRYPDAKRRANVTRLIERCNQGIRQLALTYNAAVLDTFSWFKEMMEVPEYRILGYRMQRDGAGFEHNRVFSIDGFHPGTLAQCLLANQILTLIESERVRLVNADCCRKHNSRGCGKGSWHAL